MSTKKFISLLLSLLLVLSFVQYCGDDDVKDEPVDGADRTGEADQEDSLAWWEDAIFYQIWPRSFYDSDGDGNGDFKGMTEKIDYLVDLGVNAVWLTPMFEAPSYHGYDFVEFYEVEEDYGTMADFEEFLAKTEEKGIKVIADLVLNHISSENEWFKKSAQKIDPYTDYFIWREDLPEDEPWGKPWANEGDGGYNKPNWVWVYNETRGEYYYAAFDGSQPDLNLRNPDVVAELKKVAKFWIEKGFDGFRLDAIRYAMETGPHTGQRDIQETIDFWVDFTEYCKSIKEDVYLVGEVWASLDIIASYYQDGKSIDQNFDFEFGDHLIKYFTGVSDPAQFGESAEGMEFDTIDDVIKYNYQKKRKEEAPLDFYAPFLTNHDQNRVMYQLKDNETNMRQAAVLLLTSVGTPYIYYGEEIGMTQNQEGDDIFKRAPMQWTSGEYAGFNDTGEFWVDDGKWVPWRKDHEAWWLDYWTGQQGASTPGANVATDMEDPDSLWSLYNKLIEIRKSNPALTNDNIEFIDTDANAVAYERTAEGQSVIVIVAGSSAAPQELTLAELEGKTFENLLTGEEVTFEGGAIQLESNGFIILKAVSPEA